MKTLLATTLFAALASTPAFAQVADPSQAPAPSDPCTSPCRLAPTPAAAPAPAYAPAPVASPVTVQSSPAPSTPTDTDDDTGWHRPAGQRFTSGFRLGYMYLANFDAQNRDTGEMNADGTHKMTSLKDEFGLKSPNMFVIGYEGFYRIVGHSWLNVLMVGNVSVAGLDQSKFIPTANGLLGFEIQRSFELGVGVNLLPDSKAPSHMIMAAGWTPKVGSIQTPIHAFFVPDTAGTDPNTGKQLPSNWRAGATIGMNW
ncbi:MAG: hypothetical protein ACM31C_10515 [Acidobacteriota bacterium]